MGSWGYVLLAYGIVWSALLLYLVRLKSHMRKANAKLAQIRSRESMGRRAK
jgi:CcmD family protein